MLMYPQINPIAVSIGPLKVHWYGVMYILSFLFVIVAGKYRIKKLGHPFMTAPMVEDFMFYGALGTIVGGRLGYCLFYKPAFYLINPLQIFSVWDGGMSFHGGFLGVCLAFFIYSRKIHCKFFELADFFAIFVPMCLFFGRVGNFINGELWGRFCNPSLPWGMVFPASGSMLPRHPSELYEALFEGIVLLIIMFTYARKPRKTGQISCVFAIGYGVIRFGLEFFREPDSFATGIVQSTGLSLGQIYSIPMILLFIFAYFRFSKAK